MSNNPEIIDQILSGILVMLFIFLPNVKPIDKNINWKVATSRGKIKEAFPITLFPIPIHKLSRDKARPKYEASPASIFFELSKSELIGFLIIWIVIPRDLIKNLYIFFCFLIFETFLYLVELLKDCKMIHKPIENKIKKLNILQTIDGRNSLMKLPIPIDILANSKAVINNIILAKIVILVSLIPYVIPRPKESILEEIASIK